MPTTDLVSPNAIIPAMKVNGKKQALQEIAAKAAELTGHNEKAVLEILLQREKLGSTGVGNGVAIPHGKLQKLGSVFGLFARLERPIACIDPRGSRRGRSTLAESGARAAAVQPSRRRRP